MMIKRILHLSVVIVAVCSFFASSVLATASGGKCGDNLTWTIENGDTLVIGGSGAMYDFKWVIDGPEASDIPWFSYRTGIKALVIQNGCAGIGKLAFAGLGITKVELPDSVKEVGANAFAGCPLDEARIPASVLSIGMNAFGFAYSTGVPEKMNEHFTISGAPGSAAERYAQANGFAFKAEAQTARPSVSVTVNGSAVRWTDAVPFINSDGRTMVPLRAVGDSLGLTVDWDNDAREAVFTDGM